MPVYASTLLIHFAEFGWSETFYQNAANHGAALGQLGGLATDRAAMLDPTISIDYKVSQVDIRGDSLYGVTKSGTWAADGSTMPSLCVEITKVTPTFKRGITYLRGIPPTQVTGVNFTPVTAFATALTTYKVNLQDNWMMRVALRPIPPPPASPWTYETIDSTHHDTQMKTRRVGRGFFLPRGRRRVS